MKRLVIVMIALFPVLTIITSAQLRTIRFAPANTFDSGIANPGCVATGDFNGDGNQDFAIANHFNKLSVFLGNGDGTFSGPVIYTQNLYVQGCVAAGDFNGDGKLDLAIVGGGEGSIALLTGNGDGTFNPPVYSVIELGGASLMPVVADFNKDGKLDIFIGGNGSSELLLGDGKGNFTEGALVQVSGFNVAVGDFNGDGNLDVAETSPFFPNGSTISVALGNGDGTFQTPQTYPTLTQCDGIAAGNFTHDRNLDLAVTIDSALQVFAGNGDGTFTSGSLGPTGSLPANIVAADFNKDGRADLVTPDFGGNGLTILTGVGNGTFGTAPNVLAGASPAFVAVADFNHDGSPDFVVANFGDGTVSVALNNGGTFMGVSQQQSDTSLTLTVTVQGSVVATTVPTGGVEFQDHGEMLGRAVLQNGVASITIAVFEKLPPKVTVLYSGDRAFNPNQTVVGIGGGG